VLDPMPDRWVQAIADVDGQPVVSEPVGQRRMPSVGVGASKPMPSTGVLSLRP